MNKRRTVQTKQNNILKGYHHFRLKLRQLFCMHGDHAYMEWTTQSVPKGGKCVSYVRACKKCGFVEHRGRIDEGVPKMLRDSYDKTYLKITDKKDRSLSKKGE